jgi:hypothetical protein
LARDGDVVDDVDLVVDNAATDRRDTVHSDEVLIENEILEGLREA